MKRTKIRNILLSTEISKPKKAFTLVELIVVITILGILGTIAFVTFQGYFKTTRDSVRMETVQTIHKGLQIFATTNGTTYPEPDDAVDIVGVSYQGYVGENVGRIIKLFGKTTDPLDGTKYLYSLDKNKKKIQVSVYLEEGNPSIFSYNSKYLVNQTYASNTIEYEKRFLYTYGDKVGVFLDKESNKPIQEIFSTGSLDLTEPTNTGSYKVYFTNSHSNSGVVEGTGQNLLTNVSIIQNSCILGKTVIQSGGQKNAYLTDIVAYNQTCIPILRKCENGILKGDENYKFDTCTPATANNCTATNYNGYNVPNLTHNTSQNLTKTIAGGTANITATCIDGVLSYGSESITCSTNYVLDNGECKSDVCTGNVPIGGILNGTQKYNVSWTYNTTPGQCTYVCNAGYYWDGNNCTVSPAGSIVPSQGQTTPTTCSDNNTYQDQVGQTSCKTVSSGYYSTPVSGGANTGQIQCEANNYCVNGVKTACPDGHSSPIGSNNAGACTINQYTISGSFGANANGASINVCGTNVTADTSGNFTTTRNYGAVCNTITATRSGYSCTTSTNGPASLTANFTTVGGSCSDNQAPTITNVTTSTPSCNTIRFTINGASDNVGLHATPYSFDGGSSWQTSNYKDYSNTSYTINANLIKVKDSTGNIYSYASAVSGTSAACYTYSWNTGSFGTCNGTTVGAWGGRGSCSASCGGGLQYRYRSCNANSGSQTRTVTCRRSDGVDVLDSYCTGIKPTTSQVCTGSCGTTSESTSCNTQSCCTPNGSYTYGSCSVSACGQTGTKPKYNSCGTYVGTESCSTAACTPICNSTTLTASLPNSDCSPNTNCKCTAKMPSVFSVGTVNSRSLNPAPSGCTGNYRYHYGTFTYSGPARSRPSGSTCRCDVIATCNSNGTRTVTSWTR